jgi:two-component system, NarL family, sensor histidine kinase DegS
MKPYTRRSMELRTLGDRRGVGFQALYAEAKQVLSHSANQLRALAATAREESSEALVEWQRLREELDALSGGNGPADELRRAELERAVAISAAEIARQRSELERLDVTVTTLEASWLFLEHGEEGPPDTADLILVRPAMQMRILEAQESERARLAQEIHDGPAQVLSNAIFQIEYIERVLDQDEGRAREELRTLRNQLQRETEEMRSYIHQLQNPLIGELGLNGAIRDYAENLGGAAGMPVHLDLQASEADLNDAQQTVILRVIQEALRNVRRHAKATQAWVATSEQKAADGGETAWTLEIRDDGEGFPVEATIVRGGRKNFGLRFMRERAELIGARLSIDSRPAAGTTVRLSIAPSRSSRDKGGTS